MSEETEAAPTQEAEIKEEEANKEPQIKDLLAAFPGAPSDLDIEALKDTHGDVLCTGFSASEIFIFRAMTRKEFVTMQLQLTQAQSIEDQLSVEEQIVHTCVLWASPPGLKSLETKAGSLSTLHEQIMQNSNFVNPAMAASMVIKL